MSLKPKQTKGPRVTQCGQIWIV